MPSLDMYLDDVDAARLLAIYNADPEIAFIVSAGTGNWIAQRELAAITDRSQCLWHIPSGSLPLLAAGGGPDGEVADPWLGWSELRAGQDRTTPYFGPGHVGVIWWNVRADAKHRIGLTTLSWIGNRYAPTPADTARWWKRQVTIMKKHGAIKIPRVTGHDGSLEAWAWPSALERIRAGTQRATNPEPYLAPSDPATPMRAYRASERFDVGERIAHATFGPGEVRAVESGKVSVLFESGMRVLVQAK